MFNCVALILCFIYFLSQYNTPTYDPKKYALNAKVLRNPSLMTPSERKRFADDERKRLGELDRRQQ